MSLNFDNDFRNIYDNLYEAHQNVLRNTIYKVNTRNPIFKKKCIGNYNSVKQHVRFFKERHINKLFEDALELAAIISKDQNLETYLNQEGVLTNLTFGINQLDIVKYIHQSGKQNGIKSVNIENWTILVYIYFAMEEIDYELIHDLRDNSFVKILKAGDIVKNSVSGSSTSFIQRIYEKVIFNGFTTYYRFLFSTAIFSNGKAIDFERLRGCSHLDISRIKCFFAKFDLLLTLNFDRIAEHLYAGSVHHLHGEFVVDKEEYIYHQSLGLKTRSGYVSFSDILLDDYFSFKSYIPTVNSLSSKHRPNKESVHIHEKIENAMNESSIEVLVIFGMNIENDHHVLRNIMLSFHATKQKSPHIIYCYFNEMEKNQFDKEFHKSITFGKDLNKYAKSIQVSYMRTQNILNAFFIVEKYDSEGNKLY